MCSQHENATQVSEDSESSLCVLSSGGLKRKHLVRCLNRPCRVRHIRKLSGSTRVMAAVPVASEIEANLQQNSFPGSFASLTDPGRISFMSTQPVQIRGLRMSVQCVLRARGGARVRRDHNAIGKTCCNLAVAEDCRVDLYLPMQAPPADSKMATTDL